MSAQPPHEASQPSIMTPPELDPALSLASAFRNATTRLDVPSSYLLTKARVSGDATPLHKCMESKTVYVGHLPLSTTEEQILELFSTAGPLERVVMGLNAHTQAPTGFCFVEFKSQQGALNAVKYLNKTKINSRAIDVDLDPGFEEGRQYGRGENGAQRGAQRNQFGGRGRGRGRGRGGPPRGPRRSPKGYRTRQRGPGPM